MKAELSIDFAGTGRKRFTNCGDLFEVVFQTGLKRAGFKNRNDCTRQLY